MNLEKLYEKLEGKLLVERNGEVTLSSQFLDAIQAIEAELENATKTLPAPLKDRLDSEEINQFRPFISEYIYLTDEVGLSDEEVIRVITLLDSIKPEIKKEGTPEGFVSISFERLTFVLQFKPRSIVYIWREECPPCEIVREDLEAVCNEENGVFKGSVYGPDYAAKLDEEFEVKGGPTTLFLDYDCVTLRLVGAYDRNVVARHVREVEQGSFS